MRVLRWMIIALGVVGGAIGLGAATQAAPLQVAAIESAGSTNLVEQARWRHHRRHWHRRHHWHHRHHWRRHHGWGHRHYGWHRPHRARIFY